MGASEIKKSSKRETEGSEREKGERDWWQGESSGPYKLKMTREREKEEGNNRRRDWKMEGVRERD